MHAWAAVSAALGDPLDAPEHDRTCSNPKCCGITVIGLEHSAAGRIRVRLVDSIADCRSLAAFDIPDYETGDDNGQETGKSAVKSCYNS